MESKLKGVDDAACERTEYVEEQSFQDCAKGIKEIDWWVVSWIGFWFMEFGDLLKIFKFDALFEMFEGKVGDVV